MKDLNRIMSFLIKSISSYLKDKMSTSELFALRNKLLKNGLQQFRRIVQEEKIKLDINDLSNLFLVVYQNEGLRKQMIQYLRFFINYDGNPNILNIEIINRRRLLEDLCYYARTEQVRGLIGLFEVYKLPLRLYSINKLIGFALEGENTSENVGSLINYLASCQKYFPEVSQDYEESEDNYLCLRALQKQMLYPALLLLKFKLGRLDSQYYELFTLPAKIPKKEIKILQDFVRLYLQETKCNPYMRDNYGKTFMERLSKDCQGCIEDVIKSQQKRVESKQNVRRSQHKIRSSMGPGQNFKQYNTEALQQSSRQKMVITIQNSEDELSIQREANKIYENIVNEKQKYYRYEKKQKKEGQQKQKRVGIMKSQQLRYYLQEDIKYEVQVIKQENQQYKCHFEDLIHKLKEKLSAPLIINLEVFGSFRTELCLPQSDIDIAITSENQEEQANPLKLLGQIQYILLQQQMKEYIQSVKFIKTATVPIIKVTCTEKYWRKKIDFTYQDVSHNGLQSVKLIRQYLDEYPQLQSLIFVLKKFIYISNLSAPYLGGISSYGLILMIVAYIQQQYKLHQSESEKLLVADLLIGFLKFYGFKVNYVMKSIQVFDKSKMLWQNYTGCVSRYNDPTGLIDVTPKLVIIDPLNENNNVGRATRKIKQIQMAFEIAYLSLHTFRQCGKKRKCSSYRKISKVEINDIKYSQNVRPCCLLKRMFSCTQKFIKE